MKNIIIKLTFLFILCLIFSKNVIAQDAATNQYKQMGGIAGLTEICYNSKNLELTLIKQIGQLFYTQPEMGEMMFTFLYAFYDAKAVALEKKVVWNGTSQSYNKKQIDCRNEADKKLIKQFETQLMN